MSTEIKFTMAQNIKLHYGRADVGYSKAEVQNMAVTKVPTAIGILCTFTDGSSLTFISGSNEAV